jgi:hypothetical protein
MLPKSDFPIMTTFIISARPILLLLGWMMPCVAVATLRMRNTGGSFYILGTLILLLLVQIVVLFEGLSAPFFRLMQMVGAPEIDGP